MMKIRRGDICYAKLTGVGHEQSGIRPVIIISNDACNQFSPTTTVIPLTSQKKGFIPTHVKMKTSMGLNKSSIALAECITTIDKSSIISKAGECSKGDLLKIEISILVQVGINIVDLIKSIFKKEVCVNEGSVNFVGNIGKNFIENEEGGYFKSKY